LAELDDGDTMIVTRLDRLARSTRDLLNTLAAIGAANATPFARCTMRGRTPRHRTAG
jgi:hypothetical protein